MDRFDASSSVTTTDDNGQLVSFSVVRCRQRGGSTVTSVSPTASVDAVRFRVVSVTQADVRSRIMAEVGGAPRTFQASAIARSSSVTFRCTPRRRSTRSSARAARAEATAARLTDIPCFSFRVLGVRGHVGGGGENAPRCRNKRINPKGSWLPLLYAMLHPSGWCAMNGRFPYSCPSIVYQKKVDVSRKRRSSVCPLHAPILR